MHGMPSFFLYDHHSWFPGVAPPTITLFSVADGVLLYRGANLSGEMASRPTLVVGYEAALPIEL